VGYFGPALLCFVFVLSSLSDSANARQVRVSWVPPASSGVAGYNLYVGRAAPGPLVARPIDVGRPQLDAQGIARVVLDDLDLTAPRLALEITAYDAGGRESERSNRVTLPGDGETLGTPLWSSDFEGRSLGSSPPGFFDYGGDFSIDEFNSGGPAMLRPKFRPAASRPQASSAPRADPGARSEIEAGLLTWSAGRSRASRCGSCRRSSLGISARHRAAGDFVVDQVGKLGLTCASSDSTDVLLVRFRWHKFRLRYTNPDGRARLRAKVWDARELEPSAWQVDCWTDQPDSNDSGVFALFHTGSGVTYWDDLVVRPVTGGLTTPFQ
jgi:hypothetical protein